MRAGGNETNGRAGRDDHTRSWPRSLCVAASDPRGADGNDGLLALDRQDNKAREARGALAQSSRHGLRIVHFSVQRDHLHLLVEAWIDPCSSAAWFDGYRDDPLTACAYPDFVAIARAVERPVVAPRSWLAGVGWRRHGPLGIDESPRLPD